MILSITIFCGILTIATVAVVIYYMPEPPYVPPIRKRKISEKKPLKISPLSLDKTGESDESQNDEDQTQIKTSLERTPSNLRDYFVPSEKDIYHDIDRISTVRWNDLEYTLDELSRLPSNVTELLAVLNDPASSSADIARLYTIDVDFTGRVLKLVNSPFLGLGKQIGDIRQAVCHIGFEEIRQLVLASHIFGMKEKGPINIDDLWNHSLATSRITSWLGGQLSIKINPVVAGTAALLHDVGKLVLESWRPETYKRVLQRLREESYGLSSLEIKELGISHELAAVLLLDRWNFPPELISIIKGCHLPVVNPEIPETALVWLAGQVADYMAVGSDCEAVVERIPDDVRELLGLEWENVGDLLGDSFKNFVKSVLSEIGSSAPVQSK